MRKWSDWAREHLSLETRKALDPGTVERSDDFFVYFGWLPDVSRSDLKWMSLLPEGPPARSSEQRGTRQTGASVPRINPVLARIASAIMLIRLCEP
jgi:hypothetical protein